MPKSAQSNCKRTRGRSKQTSLLDFDNVPNNKSRKRGQSSTAAACGLAAAAASAAAWEDKVKLQMKDTSNASENFRKALKIDETHSAALYNLSLISTEEETKQLNIKIFGQPYGPINLR